MNQYAKAKEKAKELIEKPNKQSLIHEVMPSPFLSANENAIVQDEFKAYSVSWRCSKGHINFQTIIGKQGTQHDICLKCGKHYEYVVEQD